MKQILTIVIFCVVSNSLAEDLGRAVQSLLNNKEVKNSISIMTFNVENLFDTKHDQGKNDYTYLPVEKKKTPEHIERCKKIPQAAWRTQCLKWDWSESVVNTKLQRIADTVKQVNGGKGPDILALQEIENIEVLNKLRKEYLNDSQYTSSILIEGRDERGIDVAFLTRLPIVGSPKLHDIPFNTDDPQTHKDTRGILQVTFRLPSNDLLTGFAVHFPAPFHPTKYRVRAYQFLRELTEKLPPNSFYFAAGDFNTTAAENAKQGMLTKYVEPWWLIPHKIGCPNCTGTSYHNPTHEWSFLDMILLSNTFLSGNRWQLVPATVKVVNECPVQCENGYPVPFRLPVQAKGVSDHLPLYLEIVERS